MSESPLLVIYGATGATGTHLVQHALAAGLRVRAFVRSPDKLPEEAKSNPSFSVHKGDLSDAAAVAAALEGATYAISVAGNARLSADGIMQKFVAAVVDGMKTHNVTRFVFQAGAFSHPPDSELSGSIKMMRPVLIRLFGIKHMVLDNDNVIDTLKAAKDIQWAVTMPAMIKEGESKGKLKHAEKSGATVMFTDLAAFNLEVVQSDQYNGKGLFPGY